MRLCVTIDNLTPEQFEKLLEIEREQIAVEREHIALEQAKYETIRNVSAEAIQELVALTTGVRAS